MSEFISIKQLSFTYPGAQKKTLKDVSLEIKESDYLAILGTSGSGKSTLLSILGLINPPTEGQYLILGTDTKDLTERSVALLKNREIGFIFQNFNLLNHLTVQQNVALPLTYNADVARGAYHDKVKAALDKVAMADFAQRYPAQLSGGQQQRIAIARAIVNNPSLILADEPTGNLDSENSQRIFEIFDQLNNAGKTLCLITHDENYARRAKRQLRISDGQLHEF